MWVMTTGGFVSAVQHRNDPAFVMVRGRDKKSLENMLESIRVGLARAEQPPVELPEIQSEGKGQTWDYPHRVVISKSLFQWFLLQEVDEYLDYTNFKSAATHVRGEAYHKALMNVWTDMRAITEPEYRWSSTYTGGTTSKYVPGSSKYASGSYSSGGGVVGKYGTTYSGASAFGVKSSPGSEDSGSPGAGKSTYNGTLYEWDDDGNVTNTTQLYRSTSIHDLPEGVDPDTTDDIIDVDEDGVPIHGRAEVPTDIVKYELPEIDSILEDLDAFDLEQARTATTQPANATTDEDDEDDSIYRVNGVATELAGDELFEAWLERRNREDSEAEAEAVARLTPPDDETLDDVDAAADARFRAWLEERKSAGAGLPEVEETATLEIVPDKDVASTPE